MNTTLNMNGLDLSKLTSAQLAELAKVKKAEEKAAERAKLESNTTVRAFVDSWTADNGNLVKSLNFYRVDKDGKRGYRLMKHSLSKGACAYIVQNLTAIKDFANS